MPYDQELAQRVRVIFERANKRVEEKRMFGGLCFMVDGKMCVGVERERLMVRFDPARTDEIMNLDGAGPMDFTKRVMKGFAFVETRVLATRPQLEFWINLALDFNKHAKSSKRK